MMRVLLQILLKELLQLLRTPALVFLLVLCPVVVVGIVPAGFANQTQLRVDVVDESFSGRGRDVIVALSGAPQIARVVRSMSLEEAERRMDLGETDAIVVVPQDGGDCRVQVDATQMILARDAAYYVGLRLSGIREDDRLQTHALFASGEGQTHYYLVAMLVLMIAIIGCSLSALSVVNEKESKAMEHLRSTGMGERLYVLSKVLFFLLLGLVEFAFGLVIARLRYGLECAGPVWELFVLAGCFLFTIVNMGILIAVTTRTLVRAIYVLVFVFVTLILLSTMFAPLDNMTPLWAATRYVNPFFWITDGSWMIALKGYSIADNPEHSLVLLGLGSILSVINIKKVKKLD